VREQVHRRISRAGGLGGGVGAAATAQPACRGRTHLGASPINPSTMRADTDAIGFTFVENNAPVASILNCQTILQPRKLADVIECTLHPAIYGSACLPECCKYGRRPTPCRHPPRTNHTHRPSIVVEADAEAIHGCRNPTSQTSMSQSARCPVRRLVRTQRQAESLPAARHIHIVNGQLTPFCLRRCPTALTLAAGRRPELRLQQRVDVVAPAKHSTGGETCRRRHQRFRVWQGFGSSAGAVRL